MQPRADGQSKVGGTEGMRLQKAGMISGGMTAEASEIPPRPPGQHVSDAACVDSLSIHVPPGDAAALTPTGTRLCGSETRPLGTAVWRLSSDPNGPYPRTCGTADT